MSLNELPNECLLLIFRFIEDFNDLTNCYQVCGRWSNLILERTRKVEYLITKSWFDEPGHDLDRVYHVMKLPIDASYLLKLIPNLKIADIASFEDASMSMYSLLEELKKAKNLKGLIDDCRMSYKDKLEYFPDLEMMNIKFPLRDISKVNTNVKQIYSDAPCSMQSLNWLPIFFPNLERLRAFINDSAVARYSGPELKNLKILELLLSPCNRLALRYGFQMIESCPVLKSAAIHTHVRNLMIDNPRKHENLQDLVLFFLANVKWNTQKRLLAKYPNLKHLSLQYNQTLTDKNVCHIISTLPKLRLLDVRGSYKITSKSSDFVQDYCKQHGRSIKFYYEEDDKQIELDWPQLSARDNKIGRGFDFMKHCFLKNPAYTPYFLDPTDL